MRDFIKKTKRKISEGLFNCNILGAFRDLNLKKIGLIFFLLIFFFTQIPTFAGEIEDKQKELSDIQRQIQEISNSLNAKRLEEKTLANEIAIMDGQIQEIELQIQATQYQIDQTQAEIDDLNQKIADLEIEIAKEKEVLAEHIRVLYEESQTSTLEIIASSNSFSDFVDRNEYLETMQRKIKESIDKIKTLKAELDAKKQELTAEQNRLAELRSQQEAQRQQIAYQRSTKEQLLIQTKSDEANFQEELKKAQQIYAEIQAWLNSFLGQKNFVSQGKVSTGDVIGLQGYTGYSFPPGVFGSHLHFGVYIGNVDVDPMPYLTSGALAWPLVNPIITQGYWGTFSHRGVGWPGGIDMVQYNGAPVMAAAAGDIIYNSTTSGFGHHVIINHGNNLFTLYGHLQ